MPLPHPNRPISPPYPAPGPDSDGDDPDFYGPMVRDYPYRIRHRDEYPRGAVRVELGHFDWIKSALAPNGDIVFFSMRALCPRFLYHIKIVLGEMTRFQMLHSDIKIEIVDCFVRVTVFSHSLLPTRTWEFPYVSNRSF